MTMYHVYRCAVGRMTGIMLVGFWAAHCAASPASEAGPPSCDQGQHKIGCAKARAMAQRLKPSGKTADVGGTSREAMTNTDVLHYDLDIEISNINTGAGTVDITGSNRMTIRSLSSSLTEFTFRLQDSYTITGAFVNDVTPVTVSTQSWTTRVATLDRTYTAGEEFALTIAYTGTATGIAVTTQSGIPVVSTLSESFWAFTWWPCKDGPMNQPGDNSDKATMEFSITVPDNFNVPSNGLLQSVEPLGEGLARYNWVSAYPITTYLVSFAITEYDRWTEYYVHDDVSMPVEFYIYASNNNASNRAAWSRSVDMIGTFAGVFGEYPFVDEKYGIYNFPFGGGMEHQTMTGQGGGWFAFYEPLTAHELAHQWWGDMITCKTWSDIWLNEGFASYSEAIWEEFKNGSSNQGAYLNSILGMKPAGNGAGDSVYVYPNETYEGRIFDPTYSYDKGAWVLHQLRHVVGDTTFFDILGNYRAAYQYSAATTDDFAAVAASTYGQDLTWFFDQWVYNAGAPTYEYGWKNENVGGQDFLHLRISQTQNLPNPAVFTMPVDIAIATTNGASVIPVWNNARDQWYTLPVDGPVTALLFDPLDWILRGPAVSAPFGVEAPATVPAPDDARKNRYVSFDPNNSSNVAIRVEMTSSEYFPGSTGVLGWVGQADSDGVSRVQSVPFYSDTWPAVVHLGDCEIVPVATYELRATWDAIVFSDPLELGTIQKPGDLYYGDVVGEGLGVLPPLTGFTPPQGTVNVTDVQAVQLTMQGPSSPNAPITWVDLQGLGVGSPPNFIINVTDLQQVGLGLQGKTYTDNPDQLDPADCP